MATATTTIVLYRKADTQVITEVFEGEQYWRPNDVTRYNGTLQEFLIERPEYEIHAEILTTL